MMIVIPSLIVLVIVLAITYLIVFAKNRKKKDDGKTVSERNVFNKKEGIKYDQIEKDEKERQKRERGEQ